jgi:hypothetical protein
MTLDDNQRKKIREAFIIINAQSDIEDINDLTINEMKTKFGIITNLAEHYIHHVLYSNKD